MCRSNFPGIPRCLFFRPGATDSAELRLHNVQSYGLLPFPLTEADELRMHADDERIPLASFRTGVEFFIGPFMTSSPRNSFSDLAGVIRQSAAPRSSARLGRASRSPKMVDG